MKNKNKAKDTIKEWVITGIVKAAQFKSLVTHNKTSFSPYKSLDKNETNGALKRLSQYSTAKGSEK